MPSNPSAPPSPSPALRTHNRRLTSPSASPPPSPGTSPAPQPADASDTPCCESSSSSRSSTGRRIVHNEKGRRLAEQKPTRHLPLTVSTTFPENFGIWMSRFQERSEVDRKYARDALDRRKDREMVLKHIASRNGRAQYLATHQMIWSVYTLLVNMSIIRHPSPLGGRGTITETSGMSIIIGTRNLERV